MEAKEVSRELMKQSGGKHATFDIVGDHAFIKIEESPSGFNFQEQNPEHIRELKQEKDTVQKEIDLANQLEQKANAAAKMI